MEHIKVKIINRSGHELPAYETPLFGGYGRARISEKSPLRSCPCSVHSSLPASTYSSPRLRMPDKTPFGTRSEEGHITCQHSRYCRRRLPWRDRVILINLSDEPFVVNDGERICQMVIKEYTRVDWEPVERLDETVRGDGGFGHTGVN